jgi:hypothetical protein
MKGFLATSAFATAAYTLTLLAAQPSANADAPAGVTTPRSVVLSPATAALRDGDDVRARGIAAIQSDQLQHTAPCSPYPQPLRHLPTAMTSEPVPSLPSSPDQARR